MLHRLNLDSLCILLINACFSQISLAVLFPHTHYPISQIFSGGENHNNRGEKLTTPQKTCYIVLKRGGEVL